MLSNTSHDFKNKYLKYKKKYCNLKELTNQLGGLIKKYNLPKPISSNEEKYIREFIRDQYKTLALNPELIDSQVFFFKDKYDNITHIQMQDDGEHRLIFKGLLEKFVPPSTEVTPEKIFEYGWENTRSSNQKFIDYFESKNSMDLIDFLAKEKSKDMNKSLVHILVRKGNMHLLLYIRGSVGPELFSDLMSIVDTEGRTPFMIATHAVENEEDTFRIISDHTDNKQKLKEDINGRTALDWLILRATYKNPVMRKVTTELCKFFKYGKDEKYIEICKDF
jgi:hypothetical protein